MMMVGQANTSAVCDRGGKTCAVAAIRAEHQWSHGFSTMEACAGQGHRRRTRAFQWSHGFSTMETFKAFFGTRPYVDLFQWSHGFSTMETQYVISCLRNSPTFQWSHGFSTMETGSFESLLDDDFVAFQWSHGFSTMETCGPALTIIEDRIKRFNGATVFQPWRRRTRRHQRLRARPFQWSHGFSTMETRINEESPRAHQGGFNGATVFQPWRPPSIFTRI